MLQQPMDNEKKIMHIFWPVIARIRNTAETKDSLYKILGLIFLKYLSDSFDEARTKLLAAPNGKANPEDPLEYIASGALYIPEKARWNFLRQNSEKAGIGFFIDEAIDAIQRCKPGWKGLLPGGYADKNIGPGQISELIRVISYVDSIKNSKDIWPSLFEYILHRFASENEKNAGEFYSPRSVIQLMVKTLAPDNGNIYDPCCGSGGMLIEANKYINEQDRVTYNTRFYGQEQSSDIVKLTTMHLAMRNINATISIGDTFVNDNLPEVKADYILANPPFNISWPSKELRYDKRWMYGIPPAGNANYVWLQHCLSKLSSQGVAAVILPNGSLNSKLKSGINIRRKMIEAGNIACIISLPSHLFCTTTIPASLWILTHSKKRSHILFINAEELGESLTKRSHKLPPGAIELISSTYHKWRKEDKDYENIPGLCKSTPIEEVVTHSYSLVPSLYVNSTGKDEEEAVLSDRKISFLNSELAEQLGRINELESPDDKIRNNLQINKTLTEIVHTAFNEWFVHFRAPLVSEKRKNTPLGLIPDNWQVMPLKEFCNLQMGYSFKSEAFKKDGDIGIIKIKNIRENFIDTYTAHFVDVQAVASLDRKYKVESNSLLIAMSGSDAGKVGLAPPLGQSRELWLNQRVGMFKEQIRFGNFFLYLLLSTPKYQSILRKSAIGTAQPNISVTAINEMYVVIPPAHLIEQFGKKMYPMFEKILANNAENKKLESSVIPCYINECQ